MSKTTPVDQKLVTQANDEFKKAFDEGPYTGFVMLDYLVKKGGLNWNKVLKEGFAKNSVTKKPQLNALPYSEWMKTPGAIMADPGMNKTWNGPTGRCTSFTVKIISELEKKYPKAYDFKIYDLGRHRIARCQKTGVLIDSSSAQGAFSLPEEKWTRIEASEASWKWVKGESKFVRLPEDKNPKLQQSKAPIAKEQAMFNCLLELIPAKSVATFFRSTDPKAKNGKLAQYHCLFIWNWTTKSLDITPHMGSKSYSIKFGTGKGTSDTEDECIATLVGIYTNNGGPNAEQQWQSVREVNETIWQAACDVWGLPVLVKPA